MVRALGYTLDDLDDLKTSSGTLYVPIIMVGGTLSFALAEKLPVHGVADHFSMGRSLIR